MYVNSAYLQDRRDAVVDTSVPLLVSSCGTFRLNTRKQFVTDRPQGRPDFQVLYISSGAATFYFDGQSQKLQAGTAVLYRPGESQLYIYRAEEKPQVYWLHFTGHDAQALLQRHGLWEQRHFYVGETAQFSQLFDAAIRELQLCRPLYKELLCNLLSQIFLLLQRQLLVPPSRGDTVEAVIWAAVSHFQKHYDQAICVADYARSHHMSSAWFIHEFKRCTGMPPVQYLQNLRLNTARGLLEGTDCTVQQAAAIVGYSDPLYFSRLFKRMIGLSPQKYRKKAQRR